ncbi:hypothetical protein HRbin29_00121 [bacterium HR29]|jgi:hypothetical protein|nr:hypothetical protein HRbin29_00121 [bacterium HR29]
MPSSKRRGRRKRKVGGTAQPQSPPQRTAALERALRPLPEWKWRTFPVYFAFSLGAFVGLYLGLIAAAGPAWLGTAVFVTVAILLGLGLSRLTTRWLVTRDWMRRREKQKTKT